jgi:hypothetical protein
MNCQNPCGMSYRTCKQVLLLVDFELVERFNPFDIFCCSPPSTASGGGRLSQGGKAKFVTSLVLSRARGLGSKQKSSESAESLVSRNLRTLDGVPRSGRMRGGTSKKHLSIVSLHVQLEVSSASIKVPLLPSTDITSKRG